MMLPDRDDLAMFCRGMALALGGMVLAAYLGMWVRIFLWVLGG